MRTAIICSVGVTAIGLACASVPTAGTLGEGSTDAPRITTVDTAHPPRSAWVQLNQPGYVALVLVAPGHSATLLYPSDSLTNNRLDAGSHLLTLQIPPLLLQADSVGMRMPARRREDTTAMSAPSGRQRADTSFRSRSHLTPLPSTTPIFLLLITSPQLLNYRRMLEKTAGVSIPLNETEALNAVAKAIKSTITSEPRDWTGSYDRIDLHGSKK